VLRSVIPWTSLTVIFLLPGAVLAGEIAVGSGPDDVQVLFNWSDGFVADYDVNFTLGASGTIDGYDATQAATADPNLTLNWTNFRTVADPNYFLNVATYAGGHTGNGATYNSVTAPNNFWHEWFNNGSGWIFGHGASVDLLSDGGAIGWVFGSNAMPVSEPTLTWNNAGGTGDGMTWDSSSQNWNSGSSIATYSDGSNVVFSDANNGNYLVTLNSTLQPGSVVINNSSGNYTIGGAGRIAGTASLAKMGSGMLTLSTTNTYSGGTTVSGGTLIVGANKALPSNQAITVAGGNLQLAPNIGGETFSSLTISGDGTLDLTNNHIIIDYGNSADQATVDSTIRGYINSGALFSSQANGSYGVGWADGNDASESGIVPANSVLVTYALYGDANLDGVVSGDDFAILVGNLGKSVSGWDQADFNHDGLVSGDDFAALVGNLGKASNGPAITIPAGDYAAIDAFAAANGLMAGVPEPGSFGLMAIAGLGILRRRHNVGKAKPRDV
jgi:autotransporter-associated beta strand protein